MIGNETRRSQAERIACRTENYPAIAESHPVAGETASSYSCATTSVVIVAPALTLASQRPKLLILDPFVRLQRADENDARQVAAILAALRELARTFNAAVLLVHHARKSGAAVPGQALRGSGDFWAWGDSNLYLSGRPNRLRLTVEHRAAPPPAPLSLQLLATDHPRAGQPPLVRLELQDHPELSEFRDPDDAPAPPPTAITFAERIVAHLRSAGPTPHRALCWRPRSGSGNRMKLSLCCR